MKVTVYHNPACGTSRSVLGILREHGIEPEIIEYLKAPPTRMELVELLRRMDMKPRDLMRAKEKLYSELDLNDPKWTDVQLVDFMIAHPILMNRPVVVTEDAVRLYRPAETVLELIQLNPAP